MLNPIAMHRERGQIRTGRKEEMEEEGVKAMKLLTGCIKSVFLSLQLSFILTFMHVQNSNFSFIKQ